MNNLFQFFIIFITIFSTLNANEWKLKNISFQTENDADIRDDGDYTYGGSVGVLFYRGDINSTKLSIPFSDYKNSQNYISFNIAHKMFTPQDFESSDIIEDDRPYAGYFYLQSALHQSKNRYLQSLIFQVGMIGPSVKMEETQKLIHSLIGSDEPQGWKYQLKDELILQINYSLKKYIDLERVSTQNYSSSIIPEFGVELGNASTKVYTSALFRWGKNTPKDYGAFTIDNTNYSKIPLKEREIKEKKYRYYINIGLKVNLIARDIFLDGNSFKESSSVDKNTLTANFIYGFSFAYKRLSIDYIRQHSTKEFKTQERAYSYGSLLFSYAY